MLTSLSAAKTGRGYFGVFIICFNEPERRFPHQAHNTPINRQIRLHTHASDRCDEHACVCVCALVQFSVYRASISDSSGVRYNATQTHSTHTHTHSINSGTHAHAESGRIRLSLAFMLWGLRLLACARDARLRLLDPEYGRMHACTPNPCTQLYEHEPVTPPSSSRDSM